MPPISSGNKRIGSSELFWMDQLHFFPNSYEFRNFSAEEGKALALAFKTTKTKNMRENGKRRLFHTRRNKLGRSIPVEAHSEDSLDPYGSNRLTTSATKATNRIPVFRGIGDYYLDGNKAERLQGIQSGAIRRPTATTKPRVGPKKSAVKTWT